MLRSAESSQKISCVKGVNLRKSLNPLHYVMHHPSSSTWQIDVGHPHITHSFNSSPQKQVHCLLKTDSWNVSHTCTWPIHSITCCKKYHLSCSKLAQSAIMYLLNWQLCQLFYLIQWFYNFDIIHQETIHTSLDLLQFGATIKHSKQYNYILHPHRNQLVHL